MPGDAFRYDALGIIRFVGPGGRHRIRMAAPTKGAFVGTGQGRCAFHTPVGIDAIEGVFIALALTQHGALGPTALFNGTVATHQPVALLLQELPSIWGDHRRMILRDL